MGKPNTRNLQALTRFEPSSKSLPCVREAPCQKESELHGHAAPLTSWLPSEDPDSMVAMPRVLGS